jgi:hypothetical protein
MIGYKGFTLSGFNFLCRCYLTFLRRFSPQRLFMISEPIHFPGGEALLSFERFSRVFQPIWQNRSQRSSRWYQAMPTNTLSGVRGLSHYAYQYFQRFCVWESNPYQAYSLGSKAVYLRQGSINCFMRIDDPHFLANFKAIVKGALVR